MPRERLPENVGLPVRWVKKHGAYYYNVPPSQRAQWDGKTMFPLGKKLTEAYRTWADRAEIFRDVKTFNQLFDRFALEHLPTLSAASQTDYQGRLPYLRRGFGDMLLSDPFEPQMCYQYVARRSKKTQDPKTKRWKGGRIAGIRDIEVLSSALTKAIEWGYINKHPFRDELRFVNNRARDRYVEDWEVVELLSLESRRKDDKVRMLQAYLRIKLLTGLAQGDMLRLEVQHLTEEGIVNIRHKTKTKGRIFTWTPELAAAAALAKGAKGVSKIQLASPLLFTDRYGKGYVDETTGKAGAFQSLWKRYMKRLIRETDVTEPFTEHDLRAKVASDADTLEHAKQLMSHADARTTERIYRRRFERVKPLR